MRRRDLLTAAAGFAGLPAPAQAGKPNILWITCEDMSPNLGCYGDTFATSPNLDRFASRSLRYWNVWSNAPVCAPARTTIISGMYPPSTGAEHMRSITKLGDGQKMFPCYLREAGYYCTNNAKEDYNLELTGKVWDESGNKAHWRNRAKGQPFFAVFNFLITHESQIRTRPHTWVHDPAKVKLPAYHPDALEVRQDWAQYYDNITEMDRMAGQVLAQLEEDGLAGDTIVFFYSDHGSGMPRSKRWPYNSGLHVPMMVHVPEKWQALAPAGYQAGGTTDRLVSFVDLAPTMLSIAGIAKPPYHQGFAFLGQHAEPEQPFVYGFRGRMDERVDLVRSVRDKRYVYIRNFMPHRIYGQYLAYMFETPATRKWKELYDAGKLNAVQKKFWETKPAEELYDLQADRDEVNNLAVMPDHQQTLQRMRRAQQALAVKIRDVGFLPEAEFQARAAGGAPYTMGHDAAKYSIERVLTMADAATATVRPRVAGLVNGLSDAESGVRYWSAVGLMISGKAAVLAAAGALEKASNDVSPPVRTAAAEALARYGSDTVSKRALEILVELANLEKNGVYTALLALNALDNLGARVNSYQGQITKLPQDSPAVASRMKTYVPRLIERLAAPR